MFIAAIATYVTEVVVFLGHWFLAKLAVQLFHFIYRFGIRMLGLLLP